MFTGLSRRPDRGHAPYATTGGLRPINNAIIILYQILSLYRTYLFNLRATLPRAYPATRATLYPALFTVYSPIYLSIGPTSLSTILDRTYSMS